MIYSSSPWCASCMDDLTARREMMSFDRLQQDVRYAWRRLAQSKGFTFVAILTLALGIGANTAIFTLIDAVMLKPLPVRHAAELYRLGDDDNCCVISGLEGPHFSIFSYSLYQYLRDHTPEFRELAAFQAGLEPVSVAESGSAYPLSFTGELVSGNYFSTLGVEAYRGRLIRSDDDQAMRTAVAVMSYRAWQQYYSGRADVVGRNFTVQGVPVTIIGITPPAFFGETLRANPPDFWIPLAQEPAMRGANSLLSQPDEHWLYILGRLGPKVNKTAVEARVNVELQQWLKEIGASRMPPQFRRDIPQQHVFVTPARSGVGLMKIEYTESLKILTGICGLVLLIACANIANLLLARGAANQIQISIRLALGAGRWQLIRQTITESVLLALLGGVAGIFVAYEGTGAILALAFRGARYVPISADPSLPVLGFAWALSVATGIVFGLLPAWIASRAAAADALRSGSRAASSHSMLPQRTLVVLQAALSFVLLCGAGLLTQSLRNLEHQQFGFQTQHRMTARVNAALAEYSPPRLYGIYRQLQEKLEAIPGVRRASFALYSPFSGDNWSSGVSIEGRAPYGGNGGRFPAAWDRVSPHYFETIGTPVLAGRAIEEGDTPASRHVAVINESFAQRYFKNENPLGKHFGLGGVENSLDYEIIGIVGDSKYHNARIPAQPMFFLPLLQMSAAEWAKTDLARSNYIRDIELSLDGHATDIEPLVRRAVTSVDPHLSVFAFRSFDERIGQSFNRERLIARLTECFGMLALLLASVGLYGVTAYSVARRTAEIGVRVALGAARREIIGMILWRSLVQSGIGLGIGVPIFLSLGRLLRHQLYQVKSYDPLIH